MRHASLMQNGKCFNSMNMNLSEGGMAMPDGPERRAERADEPFPRQALDHSIPARFAEVVRRYPDLTASSSENFVWTYRRLDAEANRVAAAIRASMPRSRTAILLNLSHDAPAIAALLAVLKTGNYYCALEPRLAIEQLRRIVDWLSPALVICDDANAALSAELSRDGLPLLNIDRLPPGAGVDLSALAVSCDDLAYVYLTSGSTGAPKGVMDSHRNVLHNVLRYTNSLQIHCDDRLSLLQALSFSGSVSSLFCALLNGATVCPFDIRRRGSTPLAQWIAAQRLTMFHAVPAIFRLIAAEGRHLTTLRIIRLEGDQATPADARLFQHHFAGSCILVNGLGATECGIIRQYFMSTDTPIPPHGLPIGRAVEDMDILLLDEAGNQVAPGEIGEIAVKSRFLALGYWRQPDITAKSFIADPAQPELRLYRTGDLGRMDQSECLEYLGRKDARAKLNGQWVDLAALEAEALRIDGVREAVAMMREDQEQNKFIVLYYTAPDLEQFSPLAIRALLSAPRNGAARPSRLVRLDALPLTANGKVDRRALPAPFHQRPLNSAPAAPSTPTEKLLVEIWREILELESIGTEDSFLDLGGGSLQMMRMLNRVAQRYGIEISIIDFFPQPTISNLTALLYERANADLA
jgi:amino acid adenylation domain-containing protein